MSHEQLDGPRTTIRGGRMVLPDGLVEGDITVENGKIVEVAAAAKKPGEIVDASGLHVIPGVIDPHVHFREPGATHKEDLASGSRAAARGGVTSYLDMPNTQPPTVNLQALEEKKKLAAEKSLVHYGFFAGAARDNLEEISSLENIPAIKVYMGSSTGSLLLDSEDELTRLMTWSRVPIAVHAESEVRIRANAEELSHRTDPAVHSDIRDPQCARDAVDSAIRASFRTGRKLHITHLSTSMELAAVRAVRPSAPVTCEVAPHHLFLTVDEYSRQGHRVRMNPPLRSEHDRLSLWVGLRDGTVDCIATDHAPHLLSEKDVAGEKIPSGVPGVETSLPLMLEAVARGLLTIEDVVRLMCEGPARIFGMVGKGRIAEGYDADLTLVDLQASREVRNDELFTRCAWSPFEGWTLRGWPVMTLVKGSPVFRDGEIVEGRAAEEIRFTLEN